MAKRTQLDADEKPSVFLTKLAKAEARALGHTLGHFTESANGAHTARCVTCFRVASVQPREYARDGRGRGGSALRQRCDRERIAVA